MSRSHNPKIVTDGLSFAIDAANTKSYNGTTTVTDLSLNSNTATLYNSVGFASGNLGYFTFDGNNQYMEIPYNESVNITSGDFTVEFWMNSSADQTSDVLVSYGDTSTVGGWAIKTASSPNKLQYSTGFAVHPAVAGIVTDSLVLNLDAGDSNSYPGSGTTWTDLSGNGNTGTLVNGVGYSSDNLGSLTFDGTNDYVTMTASSDFNFGTGDVSIEAWIYWDGTYINTGRVIYATGGSGSLDQFGVFSGLGLYFGGVYNNVAANFPPINTWSHVVTSRIGTTIKHYINGVETASGSQTLSIGSSSVPAYIGIRGADHPFKGNIASLKIYKGKGLTPTEIKRNYNALKGRFTSQPSALDPIDPFNSIESADFSSGITTNTWNHYALVRSGNVYTPYVNAIAGSPSYDYSSPINSDLYFDNASIILNANGDNGSTDIIDSSKNNHTGIITAYNGASISTAESKFGGSSLYFDGTDDYIDCGISDDYSFGTGDFTIEFWHYIVGTDNWSSTNMIFSTMNTSPVIPGLALSLIGNQFYFWYFTSGGSTSFNLGIVPPRDTWYHVVWERKNGATLFFINGKKQIEGTQSFTQVDYTSNTLVLGRDLTYSSYAKESYIDDFIITKGVAKYTENFTPPNQASYYSNDPNYDNLSILLQGNGQNLSTNIIDSSSNNHTGIITAYNGAGISTAESKFGGSSLYFDGTNDYIDCGISDDYSFGNDPFTIEFWMRVNSSFFHTSRKSIFSTMRYYGQYNSLVYGGIELQAKIGYLFNDPINGSPFASFSFSQYSPAGSTGSSFSVPNYVDRGAFFHDNWGHIAISCDGTNHRIFFNGVLFDSITAYHQPYEGDQITIGAKSLMGGGVSDFINAYIDDFRITKGVAKYTTDFTPPDRTKIQNNEASLKFGASGIGNTNPFNGSLSNLKIYKNSLTSTEIEDNFNALKGRYGL